MLKQSRRAVTLAALVAGLVGCGGGGSDPILQRQVSVRLDSAVGAGESFQFSLGAQGLTITQANVATAFASKLDVGSVYNVNQTFGPRTCTLSASRGGTIGGADVLVTADCGAPPTPQSVSVVVTSAMAAGESFVFGLGAQQVTVTQQNLPGAFAATLLSGTAYSVNQLSGPRACTLSANRTGTVGGANVLVNAACAQAPGSSSLTGIFWAPIGAQVVLRNNAADDLSLTTPAFVGGPAAYNELAFSFATPLVDGSAYQVSLATQPASQTCSIYKGASGTLPVAARALMVGCEHTYDLVSRNTESSVRGSFFDSSAPAVGGADVAVGATSSGYGEGRFVAFVSSAVGMDGATGARRQIFWRDRHSGETRLISASPAGVEGNGDSFAPAISADGLTVVFESYASNLVAGDTNGVRDIYVWAATNGVMPTSLVRASMGPGGVQANSESFAPTVSGDGRIVAFATGASNLTGGVSGISTINVVRRDLVAGTNTLVSAGSNGAGVGGSKPVLSDDGNRLAFHSFSAQLVAGDSNGLWDIFVYQHDNASLRRVSLTASGGERNQGSESASRVVAPALSGNGRYVAYATTASNVVAGDTNGAQDVFVVDLDGGLAVKRVSVATGGAQANGDSPIGQGERVAITADGAWVGYTTAASNLGGTANNVVLHNTVTGQTRAVSNASNGVGPVSLSRAGAYLAYGAGSAQDSRFTGSGLFAYFTGVARAYFWID